MDPRARRPRARRAARTALLAALVTAAGTAIAARLTDVRVGQHPGYTRVVLETDAPAAYELLPRASGAGGEIALRIDATPATRGVEARGEAPGVAIEAQPDGSTVARIRAQRPMQVETLVLDAPPRLVLDLRDAPAEPVAETGAEAAPGRELVVPTELPEAPTQQHREALEAGEPEESETPTGSEAPAEDRAAATALDTGVTPATDSGVGGEAAPAEPAPAPPLPGLGTTSAIEAPPSVEAARPPRAPEAPIAPAPDEAGLPPVAAPSPPPHGLGLDARSLALGVAAGVALAALVFGLAAARRGEAALPGTPSTSEEESERPPAVGEPTAEPTPEPAAAAAELAVAAPEARAQEELIDLVRMHRRLDSRVEEVAARVAELADRLARLEEGDGAQRDEIASQRIALARLQRALARAPEPAAARAGGPAAGGSQVS